jgi:hypothetical protein
MTLFFLQSGWGPHNIPWSMHISLKKAVFVLGTLLWVSDALHKHSEFHEMGSSRNSIAAHSIRLKFMKQAINDGTRTQRFTLKLRGGIGEAMDGDARPSRAISDALETFESFGQGPTSLDQSGSRFEAKPDFFNQSENRMDGKLCYKSKLREYDCKGSYICIKVN